MTSVKQNREWLINLANTLDAGRLQRARDILVKEQYRDATGRGIMMEYPDQNDVPDDYID